MSARSCFGVCAPHMFVMRVYADRWVRVRWSSFSSPPLPMPKRRAPGPVFSLLQRNEILSLMCPCPPLEMVPEVRGCPQRFLLRAFPSGRLWPDWGGGRCRTGSLAARHRSLQPPPRLLLRPTHQPPNHKPPNCPIMFILEILRPCSLCKTENKQRRAQHPPPPDQAASIYK